MAIDYQPPQSATRITPARTQLEQRVTASGDFNWTVKQMSVRNPSTVDPETEQEFYELAERWRNDTSHISLSNEKANHFAYHQIMAMGEEVLPLIFRELPETTSDWFWALRAIARKKAPTISEQDKGRVRRIAEIWMEWGRAHGYVSG